MKRKLTLLGIAAIAMSASAQMGMYSFGIGPLNTATNSNYATTAGYFAGYNGKYDTRTSLFGSLAGQNSYSAQRSVGVGYGALYMASNLTDCVAIGDRAGARWRNASGWVQVGNAFVYTNGYLNIGNGLIKGNAQSGFEFAGGRLLFPYSVTVGGARGLVFGDEYGAGIAVINRGGAQCLEIWPDFARGPAKVVIGGEVNTPAVTFSAGNGYITGDQYGVVEIGNGLKVAGTVTTTVDVIAEEAIVGQSVIIQDGSTAGTLRFRNQSGTDQMLISFESGNLCVYTNGVKAGRISIVPDP
ncbi:MAG: hypothetical protein IJR99_12355 [Kiritimatiellae bacterium]|nr:hypothetical protein [Kiritimatiellia bacterium]